MKEKYGYTFHGKYFNLLNKYFDIVWNMERICETRNVAKKMFLNNQWKQKKKKKRNNLKTWESRCYSQLLTFLCLKLLKQSVLDIMIFSQFKQFLARLQWLVYSIFICILRT